MPERSVFEAGVDQAKEKKKLQSGGDLGTLGSVPMGMLPSLVLESELDALQRYALAA